MVIDSLGSGPVNSKIKSLLTIVLNSALHLQNVVEDALDVSRLENG